MGPSQSWLHHRHFRLDSHTHSLLEAILFCFFPVPAFLLFHGSTQTRGTLLTFLWCPHVPSITPAKHKTSPESSTTTHRSTFNLEAYKAYSPLFLPVSFAVSYGPSFALITATLTHTILYYRKQVWTHARRSLPQEHDIHTRFMSVYNKVPNWWYLTIFGRSKYNCEDFFLRFMSTLIFCFFDTRLGPIHDDCRSRNLRSV